MHYQQVGPRVLRPQPDFFQPIIDHSASVAPKTSLIRRVPAAAEGGHVIPIGDWLANNSKQVAAAQAKRDKINEQIAAAKAKRDEQIAAARAATEELLWAAEIRSEVICMDFDGWQPTGGSYDREKIYLLDPHTEVPVGRKHGREHKKVCYRNLGRKPRYKDVPRGEDPKTSGHFRVKYTRHYVTDDLVALT